MINNILLILSFLFICFLIGGMIWAIFSERKDFNHGICPICGGRLECRATDSQGGRYYICEHRYSKDKAHPQCDYSTWISWPVDNK